MKVEKSTEFRRITGWETLIHRKLKNVGIMFNFLFYYFDIFSSILFSFINGSFLWTVEFLGLEMNEKK